MKPFWVYIVRCADESYYTGHTDDLDKRISEHQSGAISSCYTFKRRPITLVFSQPCASREEALSAEQQIKGWGRKKKEAMMRGDWDEVSRLARSSANQTALRQAQGERLAGYSVRGKPVPVRGKPVPVRGEPVPVRGEPVPVRGEPVEPPNSAIKEE